VYFITDGGASTLTYKLPAASVPGQQIVIVVANTTTPANWALQCAGTDTMFAFTSPNLSPNPTGTFNFGQSSLGYVSLLSTGTGQWLVTVAN